jgi:hypothetical protein
MVLYTPLDVEMLMRDLTIEEQGYKEVDLGNGIMALGRDVESGFRIERIICGNSNAYLLPEYQPGTVIKLT